MRFLLSSALILAALVSTSDASAQGRCRNYSSKTTINNVVVTTAYVCLPTDAVYQTISLNLIAEKIGVTLDTRIDPAADALGEKIGLIVEKGIPSKLMRAMRKSIVPLLQRAATEHPETAEQTLTDAEDALRAALLN